VVRLIAALPFATTLFVGMLICLEIGRRLGARALAKNPKAGGRSSVATVEGAIFGLYALLLAFTFSGAPARLDARKQALVDEANTIHTAYLRLDLLRTDSQPALRELFRKYMDARMEVFRKAEDLEASNQALLKSEQLQHDIWSRIVSDTSLPGTHAEAGRMLLPATTLMIDSARKRSFGALIHPPAIIYALLFTLALVCSTLAGYSMAESPYFIIINSHGSCSH